MSGTELYGLGALLSFVFFAVLVFKNLKKTAPLSAVDCIAVVLFGAWGAFLWPILLPIVLLGLGLWKVVEWDREAAR